MSMYKKYMHVERYGHELVDGIDVGTVHVFPKLDGTNGVIWLDKNDGLTIRTGSRNREINKYGSADILDNAGFNAWVQENRDIFKKYLHVNQDHILYGEWLVPHTIKRYRDDAWRNFYLFDVACVRTDYTEYLSYEEFAPFAIECGISVIEPVAIIKNPTEDAIKKFVNFNTFLMEDDGGVGEGVVVKNYSYTNKFNKQVWAKVVRNEFKEDNRREFGLKEADGGFQVESAIAEEFVTGALVDKTLAKILTDICNENPESAAPTLSEELVRIRENHRGQIIPRLLQTVFFELVNEEAWTFVKKYKNPTIDFKKLRSFCEYHTKKKAHGLF